MLGRQHAASALLAGVGLAAAVPSAPWPIRVLVVVVTGGAGLLPDLDHPGATAARSLGFVTKVIAIGVDRVAVAVYHATRETGDPSDRHGGHRLLTHTVPGCLAAGLLAGVLAWVSPVAAAVSCGLLAGLLGVVLRFTGPGLAVGGGLAAWQGMAMYPGWWWLVSVAVTLGCLTHVAGDTVTSSGTPILWPLVSQGQRWRMISTPVTFSAGSAVETRLVAPLLLLGLALAVSSVTGVLPVLVTAAVSAAGQVTPG